MTLQTRLDAARDDYHQLAVPNPEPRHTPPGQERPDDGADDLERGNGRGRRTWGAIAAALILLGGVGVGVWSQREPSHRVAVGDRTGSGEQTDGATATTRPPELPEPPGPGATYSPDIVVSPAGPYLDRQEVDVTVPEGFAEDLSNGAVQQCAVLTDGVGGSGEWCDPFPSPVQLGTPSATAVRVTVRREVFTPTGVRDCEEAEVTCRLVLRSTAGGSVASAELRFEGPAVEAATTLELTGTGDVGVATLTPRGLTAHPSWFQLRDERPTQAADFPPLRMTVCAFGRPSAPEGPEGLDPWLSDPGDEELPPPNCDATNFYGELSPDAPDRPVRVTLPTWFLGYGGWSDCRVDRCFVAVRRSIVQGTTDDGSLLGNDELAAVELVDPTWVDPDGSRPAIEILTPGPHRTGDVLTVQVSGLRDDERTNFGVCAVENPWGCAFVTALMGRIGNGTHELPLLDPLICPTTCYVELDSQGEGLAPLAVAPLVTR